MTMHLSDTKITSHAYDAPRQKFNPACSHQT